MTTYNVYEQRPPIRSAHKDDKGNFVWYANLALMGQITVAIGCAIEQARKRFMVRHPMLHELDSRGDEIRSTR